MDITQIQKWIDIAKWAPSGANAQPWNVQISPGKNPKLSISVDRNYAAHPSLMDLDGSATIMALGTLTETLCQVADLDGYSVESIHFNKTDSFFNCSIDISFKLNSKAPEIKTGSLDERKIHAIKTRHTNRNAYYKKSAPDSFIEWMKSESASANLKLTSMDLERPTLIKQLKMLEKVRYENSSLFSSLMDEITLKKEASVTGIPITALGVGLDGQIAVTLLKNHPTFRKLLNWGLSQVFADGSIAKPLTHSGHFIYLSAEQNNVESYFNLGRMIQRIWLSAHESGLALQPFCGHLIAYHWLQKNNTHEYSKKHEDMLLKVQEKFLHSWNIDLRAPLFGFRLGYPIKMGEISPRKPTTDIIIKEIRTAIAL